MMSAMVLGLCLALRTPQVVPWRAVQCTMTERMTLSGEEMVILRFRSLGGRQYRTTRFLPIEWRDDPWSHDEAQGRMDDAVREAETHFRDTPPDFPRP